VYSLFIRISALVSGTVAVASCATYDTAAPGITAEEMSVLVSEYCWQPNAQPPHYTSEGLDALLRASADPTLDGARSEAQTSRLAVALAAVGDQRFAEALSQQSYRVKHMVAFFISDLWKRHGFHYPRTEAVLQKYT
jgi:hypothetical protein